MQVSTKSRYAIRAMIELALHYEEGPLQLREIARRQALSEKYLEQIMHPLRTKGLVYSQKGSRGGYFLARPPAEITVYDIVTTMEGTITPVPCVDNPQVCDRLDICVTRTVWCRLNDAVTSELSSQTLLQRAQEEKEYREAGGRDICGK